MGSLKQLVVPRETRVPLVVEVVLRVAPTLALLVGVALWAVLEGLVPISNIAEEVDLVFVCEQRRADTVHWRITPALVVETTFPIEEVKELAISLSTPEVEVTNFEVAPNF